MAPLLSLKKTSWTPQGQNSLDFLSFFPEKPPGYHGCFSSGPCAKPLNFEYPKSFLQGRSHRSKKALMIFQDLMVHLRLLLQLPEDHRLLLVPGSCSGAMDMALWNFLGPRPVCALNWDVFSRMWSRHVAQELKLPLRILEFSDLLAGDLPHGEEDVLFSWTGTTSGFSMDPTHDFLTKNPSGLVICDGAAAVFSQEIPWNSLDVTCFSFQKALGAQGGFGLMVLSPKAMERLHGYTPSWPLSRLLRLKNSMGDYLQGLEHGETINTPCLWILEENRAMVHYWLHQGGLPTMIQRTMENKKIFQNFLQEEEDCRLYCPKTLEMKEKEVSGHHGNLWIKKEKNLSPLVKDSHWRSHTPLIFTPPKNHSFHEKKPHDQWTFIKETARVLENCDLMMDIVNHIHDAPAFRLWSGPTIESSHLEFALGVLSQWCKVHS